MRDTVTLLHGFTQTGAAWDELRGLLPGHLEVLAPDLRGHGGNRRRPCDMDGCLDDLEALWASHGATPTHLVGYSMGGRLALHIAARRPELVRSLVTIGAHAGLPEPERSARRIADEELAHRIEQRGAGWFADHWDALELFAGLRRRRPDLLATLREMRAANSPAGLACSLRGMGAGAMTPVWAGLGAVAAPCLFLAGEEDGRFAALLPRLVDAVAAGRAATVPGAGHAAHLEQPRVVAELIAAHLGPPPPSPPRR